MNEHAGEMADENGDAHVAVGMRVRVYPATDAESRGVVVDDFRETAGYAVDIGDTRTADPARRWAVMLDTGTLVFLDGQVIEFVSVRTGVLRGSDGAVFGVFPPTRCGLVMCCEAHHDRRVLALVSKRFRQWTHNPGENMALLTFGGRRGHPGDRLRHPCEGS